MQTRYFIGITLLISILLAGFAGLGLAYLWFQPQVNDINTELSNLQLQNTNLTAHFNALQNGYNSLQSQLTSMRAKFSALEERVANISLVTDSSYYIFKQNNTYYAQNGLNGTIEKQDANCSSVLDYALNHVLPGGAVLLKPLASVDDAYYIDSTIYLPNSTTLASENKMVTISLEDNRNEDVISMHNVSNVQIRNIRIFGNKEHNANGSGIAISSDNSTDSNCVVEDVVIESCAMMGILVQEYPRGNLFNNVEVYRSGEYNVEIDSSDQHLVNVVSGWAGNSGFEVLGNDCYFLNCVSWGSGYPEQNGSDRNGFHIVNFRNMFVGCDADRNAMGGFVLDGADSSMLVSCIARNNGQNRTECWGFDLYNSNSTTMGGCVATDECANKTQDYGFTEGGNSDYNVVTGCNFDGNKVGAVFDIRGIHTVITNTLGYETQNFGLSNFNKYNITIPVGTNNTYGDTTNFTSSKAGRIMDFHVTIKWEFPPSSNENVTVRVQALMTNGTATLFETSRRDNGTYLLTEDDISGLWSSWSNDNQIEQLQISAKSTESSTAAAVSVFVWGSSN